MRYARFSILVFSAVFTYNLQASWDYEVSRGSTAPAGFLEFGLFQRNIDTKKGSFPVASVTTSVYEKTSKEPKTEDDLAKKLETLLPNLSWKKTIYKGVHFYTGYDEVDLRYYKLMVKDQGNKRIQTLATIRQPYVAGVSLETEYLQRVFLKAQLDKPKGRKKKTAVIWESFLSEAQAQMDLSQFTDITKGWLLEMRGDLAPFRQAAGEAGSDVRGFVKNVDGKIERYIGAVQNVNTNIEKARRTVDDTRRTLRESTAEINDSFNAGRRSFDTAVARFGDIGDRANDNWATSNNNWATSNKIAERFSDPAKVRKLAFNAALGGLAATAVYEIGRGVGTALVTFVADVVWTGIQAVWREVMGQLSGPEKEQLKRRAVEAMAEAEKQMKVINDLKQKIALTGMAWSKLRNYDNSSGVSLADNLRAKSVRLKGKKNKKERDLEDENMSEAAGLSCSNEVVSLANQMAAIENLVPILQKSDTKEALCAQLENLSDQLIDAEISLHKARSIVKEELLTYPTMIYEAHLKAHLDSPSPRKRANECKENQENVVEIYKSLDRKNCSTEPAVSSKDCRDLQRELTEFRRVEASVCDAAQILESEEDKAGKAAARLAEVNASVKKAQIATEKILQSNCAAEDTRNHCRPLSPTETKQLETFNRILDVTLKDVDKDCPRHEGAGQIRFDAQGGAVNMSPEVRNAAVQIELPPAF